MKFEVPLAIFTFTPLIAVLYVIAAYIKKRGMPDFYSFVAGLFAFFGTSVLVMVGLSFAMKIFHPEASSAQIADQYLLTGAIVGASKLGGSIFVKMFSAFSKDDTKRHE